MSGRAWPTSGGTAIERQVVLRCRAMTTKLESPLKREIIIKGEPYILTITPHGLKLVPKGRRKGYELEWQALVSGEAALAAALTASLANAPEPVRPRNRKSARSRPE
jgi:hypothetical protein